MPTDLSFLGGWVDDPAARSATISRMGIMEFRDAAPHLMREQEPASPIMLYYAWKQVIGSYPNYVAQQIGDCESFGNGHANDLRQCCELILDPKNQSTYEETCTEALYAAGRECGGMLHSWGDGCYGAAMAEAMIKLGMVPRKAVGSYDGNRAKQWGHSGMPDNVRQLAAQNKLGSVALIKDRQSAISALWNFQPIAVSSNQGFSMHRDSQGYCRAQGRWPHCMLICAFDPKLDRYLISQSWGPNTPDGPTYLEQPDFTFWADASVVERMLGLGDSFALSGSPDFGATRLVAAHQIPPEFTKRAA